MSATDSDLIPVVDYARASVDKAKDAHTVTDQQTINDKTATRLGCKIVARFADNDKSAAKENVRRDDFESMLKVLRNGKLADGTPVMGCIVVADDRLVRRAGDYERFVDAITYDDGRVFADKRGFKDLYSEDVESMGLMGAVFSRMEVKKTRRRVRTWHRGRAERGEAPRGHRAFGWTDDGITIDQREAELISKAVEDLLAGKSQGTVLRSWLEKEVKTPRGYDWTRATLRKMLTNPRLCGWRMIKGELVVVDGEPVVGQWEPIITPDQWQAVRALYEARQGKAVNRKGVIGVLARDHREHKYLLTGFLRCGRILPDGTMCGVKLRVVNDRKQGIYRYYCKDKTQGGCGGLARRGDKLDEFISEAVLAKLEERSAKKRNHARPWSGQQELDEWESAMRELRDRFRKRRVSNTFYFDEVEKLEADIARLRAERQRYLLTAEKAAVDLTDIRRRWYSETDEDRLDLSQKRAYVRECFTAIIVHPAGSGNGSRKTFNPDLIEPVWRED